MDSHAGQVALHPTPAMRRTTKRDHALTDSDLSKRIRSSPAYQKDAATSTMERAAIRRT